MSNANDFLIWYQQHSDLLNLAEAKQLFENYDFDVLPTLVDRLRNGEPYAYVLGFVEFLGLKIDVNKSVLIPRPETEQMVDEISKKISRPKNILDCCTGSGAIALALKNIFPNANVVGWDLSEEALLVASQNAKILDLQIDWQKRDALDSSSWLDIEDHSLDLFISNPPYISEQEYASLDLSVKNYEPQMALLANDLGLEFYKFFAIQLKSKIKRGGVVVVEMGWLQSKAVSKIFTDEGWSVEIFKDFSGHLRYMVVSLKKF